jgi:oligopeptidase B
MIKKVVVVVGCLIFAISCQNQKTDMIDIEAPVAKKVPKELVKHEDVRIDNYYWMNDREDQEVITHLEKEKTYHEQMTAHTKDFETSLFEEMKARIKEDDTSVPYKKDGYWYMTRYEKGKEYPIYSRKKESLDADEEILFDCNEMAEGHEFFNLGGFSISPDNSLAVFSIDTVSRRKYTLQVKNLKTGELLEDKIDNTTGSAVWANDNETFFYSKKDEVTLRADKIFKHKLSASEDGLVFNETDETFSAYVYKSKSKKYIIIGSYSTLTTEIRTLNASEPDGKFKISIHVQGAWSIQFHIMAMIFMC